MVKEPPVGATIIDREGKTWTHSGLMWKHVSGELYLLLSWGDLLKLGPFTRL